MCIYQTTSVNCFCHATSEEENRKLSFSTDTTTTLNMIIHPSYNNTNTINISSLTHSLSLSPSSTTLFSSSPSPLLLTTTSSSAPISSIHSTTPSTTRTRRRKAVPGWSFDVIKQQNAFVNDGEKRKKQRRRQEVINTSKDGKAALLNPLIFLPPHLPSSLLNYSSINNKNNAKRHRHRPNDNSSLVLPPSPSSIFRQYAIPPSSSSNMSKIAKNMRRQFSASWAAKKTDHPHHRRRHLKTKATKVSKAAKMMADWSKWESNPAATRRISFFIFLLFYYPSFMDAFQLNSGGSTTSDDNQPKPHHAYRHQKSHDKLHQILPELSSSLGSSGLSRDQPSTCSTDSGYRLHCDLLDNYRKSTRPTRHPSDPIIVEALTALYQIIELDQAKNTIVLAGSFEFYWQDEYLKWDPDEFEGTTELFVSSEDIWIPEISLYYSHHHNEEVVLRTNNDVRLNYTGHLRYYIPFTTESLCPIDVKYFPFDEQHCQLFFGSWAHSNESITFKTVVTENHTMFLDDYYDNQEWEMLENRTNISGKNWEYAYVGRTLYWSVLELNIVMKRQSFYYVFNLVIPSTIITIVAVVGFHMPSTSGRVRDAKFRLGIITLMSMSVILLAIVEDMPKFSISAKVGRRGSFSGVPLIGLFYFSLLVVIGASTITTSFFVLLERDGRTQRKIPWFLRWLAFGHWNRYHGYERPETLTGVVITNHNSYNLTLSSGQQRNSVVGNGDGTTTGDKFGTAGNQQLNGPQQLQPDAETGTPRAELRRKLSVGHYDNLVMFHYFHAILEELTSSIGSIERALSGIRHELLSLLPRDDIENQWGVVIRRLELISMTFYLSIIATILLMFFYHDWYQY